MEELADDVHLRSGVNCHDCHGGSPGNMEADGSHAGMRPLNDAWTACARCHEAAATGLVKGVHAKAVRSEDSRSGAPLSCGSCHGTNAHRLLPVDDASSPVYWANQVRTCGACHPQDEETYRDSVHGVGLFYDGLKASAVCADCHGSHGVYYAADGRSTLHPSNVTSTCSKCHHFIGERLEASVHGATTTSSDTPAGKKARRQPDCIDCHQGHMQLGSHLAAFRLDFGDECGNCHWEVYSKNSLHTHSVVTRDGLTPAARCADCHGSHTVLAIANPDSQLARGERRRQTCRKCHTGAFSNFANFDPHADFKNKKLSPKLYEAHHILGFVVNLAFAGFLLHAFLWFVRALIHRLQHGAHETLSADKFALLRYPPMHRVLYGVLIFAFLTLMLTGITLKYESQPWAKTAARAFGDFRTVKVIHHLGAVTAIFAALAYLIRSTILYISGAGKQQSWKKVLLGPDSLVPTTRDFRDLLGMLGWFVGLGRKPAFERWAYWEKADFWGCCAGGALLGASGLALWYPNAFSVVFPGFMLNVAKMVHSEFAIYVGGFLFLAHFFHAHFRPEKFPLDLSLVTGLVSESHLRKYRPAYVTRLEESGEIEKMRRKAPSERRLGLTVFVGSTVFSFGILLLVITAVASLSE